MAKYTGRSLEELRSGNVKLSDLTVPEMEMLEKHKGKTADSGPSMFAKAGLLLQATGNKVKDAVSNVGQDMTLAIVRQQIANKQKSAIEKEMAIANLGILAKNGKISQEEYQEALDQLDSEE